MKLLSKGAAVAGAGALVLGASVALSNVTAVSGASQVQPDNKVSCSSKKPCFEATNSSKGNAIEGVSTTTAVPLGGNHGALLASGVGLNGIYAYSVLRNGGWFENDSTSYVALYGQADNSDGYPLEADNYSTGGYFSVDPYGDGYFTGAVTAAIYYTAIHTREGAHVGAFNSESTRATIEDTGTARLTNGEGAVRFDPALASAIDIRQGYQVLLTPDGDTRGLYVAAKYEGGFIVRENERGRSSVNFDYRVVAHPVGSSEARLPELHLKAPSMNGRVPQ
jgi:hypothetical protein